MRVRARLREVVEGRKECFCLEYIGDYAAKNNSCALQEEIYWYIKTPTVEMVVCRSPPFGNCLNKIYMQERNCV